MTSLLPSDQKSEGGSQQYSVMREYSNSGISLFDHVSQHTMINILYNSQKLERRKGKQSLNTPGQRTMTTLWVTSLLQNQMVTSLGET